MTRGVAATVGLLLILLSIGFNTWLGIRNTETTRFEQTQLCHHISAISLIASETLEHQIRNSRLILPKISFPGLSHEELLRLTAQKEAQEKVNLKKLQALAVISCKGS